MDKDFHSTDINKQNYSAASQSRPDIYDDNYLSDETEYVSHRDVHSVNRRVDNTHYNHTQKRPAKRKSKLKKFVLYLLLFAFTLLTAIVAIGWVVSLTIPAKTTFLIMATDQDGTRTDTLMLGTFDKNDKSITLLSIPRDTYVTVSDEMYEKMNEEYPEPGSKSMKINSVHHFGGEKYGTAMLLEQVSSLLGTEIDFYAKIDFDAFRYIIDSIGGIDFYVPQNMEYHDPLQDLHISLKEGQQHLDGKQAEQLVRFRSGYANADLGRVDVQQQFMKAFISQTFSKGTMLSNPSIFLNMLFKYNYIDTDAGLFDVVSYAFVLGGIDTANIQTHTLPGKSGYAAGQSVYILNESETEKLISSMLE